MYEPDKGMSFYGAIKELQDLLKYEGQEYRIMKFNDILITVSHDSNIDDLSTIYELKRKLARL